MIANRSLLFRPPFRQKITGTLQKTAEFRKKIVMISRSEIILAIFFCVKQRIEEYERGEKSEKETCITLRCVVLCCGFFI